MRFIYVVLMMLTIIGLLGFIAWIGYRFGRVEASIMTGSPAYFMLDDVAKRLEKGDATVAADIRATLEEMDPKNNTGVNGPAMIRYMHRRSVPSIPETQASEEPTERPIQSCRWRSESIAIDGKPDDVGWRDAQWVNIFWNLGADQADTTHTKAALLWDDQGLYFASILQDTDLYAVVTEHDGNTWDDDVFELFFMPPKGFADPARVGRPYYEFEINALNTTFDLLSDGTGDQKRDFLTGIAREAFTWETAVHLTGTLDDGRAGDSRWTVEGFIPWSDFAPTGGRPAAGDTWSGILARYDFPSSGKGPRISASSPMTVERGFHDPARWATIRFVGP